MRSARLYLDEWLVDMNLIYAYIGFQVFVIIRLLSIELIF
jgi:hypothetical protein